MAQRRAIFLDRDGTLVHAYHYPSRPEHLRLYNNIGSQLRMMQAKGFYLMLITNQSGLARGYFAEADLERMHEYLLSKLSQWDVHLDAIYYCPHHVDGTIPELAISCDCRKPQPGMLFRAAREHEIDLEHSWFVGDILDDVEAGNRAGCRTVLVDLGTEKAPTTGIRTPSFVARDTLHALNLIRKVTEMEPEIELTYRPQNWFRVAKPSVEQQTISAGDALCSQ